MNSISIGTAQLAYYDSFQDETSIETTSDEKPVVTLLLVHGFPLSHAMWRPVISYLEEMDPSHSCRIIAPDLRGYGESSEEIPPTRLSDYADDLAQLLDALSIEGPIIYVGFSMGGYIFWPFLQKYENRVKGLALVDTRAAGDTEAGRATRIKMAENVEEWGADRVAQLMRPNLFLENHTNAETIEETLKVIRATAPKTIAASQYAMAARPDSTGELAKISVPTEVIVGESDPISTVEEMRSIAEAIPNSELTVIEKAGHMAPVERPEQVAKAILKLISRFNKTD